MLLIIKSTKVHFKKKKKKEKINIKNNIIKISIILLTAKDTFKPPAVCLLIFKHVLTV